MLRRTALFGSTPPPSDSIWERARREGFDVRLFERNASNKEKQVDNAIGTLMLEDSDPLGRPSPGHETMLFDSPSRVLDLGHQRSFVGAARRAVEVVHRTCTGEGCHVRSEACEIDHILPSAAGGPTVPENGRPQCRPHHRQHHQAFTRSRRSPPSSGTDPGGRLTGAAYLELARARIRDRLLHDPAWGALADARDDGW